MAVIRTKKGEEILVDDEDYDWLNQWSWRTNDGYAYRKVEYQGKPKKRKCRTVRLHHLVIGKPPAGLVTDHINRNKLDNRRSNLRHVTQAVNGKNVAHYRGGSTSICFDKAKARWVARIRQNGKVKGLGRHRTRQAALKACERQRLALLLA